MIDLEEQEQVDALKAWWKQHGNTVIMAVAVFVAVVAGIQGWRVYQYKQGQQAAALYEFVQSGVQSKDIKKIREAAGQIIDKFPGTPYAARAALISARANYEAGDNKSAKAQLQWVMDNAKEDSLQDDARLRLAGILLDEKNYADALKLLDAKHGKAYDGLYSDLKGDVLSAEGHFGEARKAYLAALEKTDQKSPFRKFIQVKLDSLGEGK